MDTTKKNYLLKVLKESEETLLAAVENITDEEFMSKPDADIWSMSELVEHLVITDTGILHSIKEKGKNVRDTTPETVSNEMILNVVPVRNRKVVAQPFLEPKGRFKSKAEALQAFRYTRNTVEKFVETTDLPLERIAFKHFLLGLINGEGWVVFMAGHCQRHVAQLQEMKEVV